MTFTTLTFVLFLAVVFLAYWTVRGRRAQNVVLVLASYCFYAWWDWRFCGLLIFSSLVDYFVGLGLGRTQGAGRRKALLGLSLLCNLGLLGFFKYFDFFAENLVALAGAIGVHLSPVSLRLVLPVGISFYTFQTLSYTFDVYRGKMRPTRRLIDYMTYVSFFPQLVAGPIERAPRLLPQFMRERHFDHDAAVDGCRQVLWGFLKKMALADSLALIVDPIYASPERYGGPQLAFATVCFAFQIYCDFSAYSDIAIGTARLFGVRLMRNFAYPYFSQSVAEFWRRWHISLATWFRDYLYIPLGGSRVGRLKTAWNVLLTFVVSGLWHGASWNFAIWGGLNGLATAPAVLWPPRQKITPEDVPGGTHILPGPLTLLRMLRTLLVICAGWVFFRAQGLGTAAFILRRIAAQAFSGEAYRELAKYVGEEEGMKRTLLAVGAFVLIEWIQRRRPHALRIGGWPRPLRWIAYTVVLWGTIYLAAEISSAFVYFQF
jgi:D-alanyl-lipoteichoic acid acyltransferase DltB (MBOAT superfamily)